MQISKLPRSESKLFSTLSNELVSNQSRFSALLNQTFDLANFGEQIKQKSANYTPENRTALTAVLTRQYASLPASEHIQRQLDLLRKDTTFTVTTGHQLNLFTGPLYFIYKILHVIRLTELLNEKYTENHFVPVYWMASEDHDFEEIKYFNLFGKRIEWNAEFGGAVGEYPLEAWEPFLAEISTFFGQSEANEVLDCIHAYRGKNLSEATINLVHHLFERYGLVVVEPNEPALKGLFKGVMDAEISTRFSEKKVLEANAVLEELGFSPQVHARNINLFYLEKGKRSRFIEHSEGIEIEGKGIFSEAEIREEIAEFPERFSPNVILRTLYQETILPNLAYIGGGGELAYWLQFKGVFDDQNLVFPLIQVRNSIQLFDTNSLKKIEKLELSELDFFEEIEVIKKKYVFQNSSDSLDFSALNSKTEALEQAILDQVNLVDPSLEKYALAEGQRIRKQMEGIQAKLIRQEKSKMEQAMKQIEDVKHKLFPGNSVQERHDNFFQYCANGSVFTFLETVKSIIDPLENELILVKMG